MMDTCGDVGGGIWSNIIISSTNADRLAEVGWVFTGGTQVRYKVTTQINPEEDKSGISMLPKI